MMATMFGVGALGSAAATSRLRRRISLPALGRGGLLVTSLGLVVVAVVPLHEGRLLGFAIAGGGFLTAATALTTQVHRRR